MTLRRDVARRNPDRDVVYPNPGRSSASENGIAFPSRSHRVVIGRFTAPEARISRAPRRGLRER